MRLRLTRLAAVPHHVCPGDKCQGVWDMLGLPVIRHVPLKGLLRDDERRAAITSGGQP